MTNHLENIFKSNFKLNWKDIFYQLCFGCVIIFLHYLFYPIRYPNREYDYQFSIFFGLAFLLFILITNLYQKSVSRIDIKENSNLLLVYQSQIKGKHLIEFDASTLTFSLKISPDRLMSPNKILIIADSKNYYRIYLRDLGIREENFNQLIDKLKTLYPQQWSLVEK